MKEEELIEKIKRLGIETDSKSFLDCVDELIKVCESLNKSSEMFIFQRELKRISKTKTN